MVKNVEAFGTELECNPFREFEVFAEPYVPIVDTRAAEYVSSTVAELPVKWLAKGNSGQVGGCAASCIGRSRTRGDCVAEPAVQTLMEAARVRISDFHATVIEAEHNIVVVITNNREREPALECGDDADLPTSDCQVGRLTHGTAKTLSATDGQLINQAIHESVVNVEI